jgi:hypothetical protein
MFCGPKSCHTVFNNPRAENRGERERAENLRQKAAKDFARAAARTIAVAREERRIVIRGAVYNLANKIANTSPRRAVWWIRLRVWLRIRLFGFWRCGFCDGRGGFRESECGVVGCCESSVECPKCGGAGTRWSLYRRLRARFSK